MNLDNLMKAEKYSEDWFEYMFLLGKAVIKEDIELLKELSKY